MSASGLDSAVAQLGLAPSEPLAPGPLTPLLAKGARFDPAFRGSLAPGRDGVLGVMAYVGEGGATFTYTAVTTQITESTAYVPRLFCERRGRMTDTAHYGFEVANTKVWTESAALNKHWKITMSPFQDENWMRQLLSPALIDRIVSEAPADFSFELAYGTLLGSVEADAPAAGEIVALWNLTAAIAAAVAKESQESGGVSG
jgi:hypothetical protein